MTDHTFQEPTNHHDPELHGPPSPDSLGSLHSDAELHGAIASILGSAAKRQAWMLYLDADQRLMELIMPFDGLPEDPLEREQVEDLGEVTHAELIATRIASIMELISATSMAIVWERLGSDRFQPEELAWAREYAHRAGSAGITVRAQFLLHDTGLRQITPDDYL